MTIKKRLYWHGFTIVLLFIVLLCGEYLLASYQTTEVRNVEAANKIVVRMTEMLILASELENYKHKRVEQQWISTFRKIETIMKEFPKLTENLKADIEALHHYFLLHKKVHEQSKKLGHTDDSLLRMDKKHAWIISKMKLESRRIVSTAELVYKSASFEVKRIDELSRQITMFILLLTFFISIYSSYRIIKTTVYPLNVLLRQINKVEQGYFNTFPNHSVKLFSKTREIRLLFDAFARMTTSLNDVFEELETEIRSREVINKELDTRNKELQVANEQIKLSENRFRSIIEQAGDAIYLSDFDGNILMVNHHSCQVLGYTQEELLLMNIVDFDLNHLDVQQNMRYINDLNSGDIRTVQSIHKHKNGDVIPVEIRLGVYDFNGNKSVLGMVRNITERKKVEADLLAAKEKAEGSDRLKTEFIHNMSHEIRTPMNGILGFASLLDKPNLSDSKKKHYISIIKNSGYQLLNIIDDILEISRLETKQVKVNEDEICLNELLLELFSVFDVKAKQNKTPLYLKNALPDAKSYIITDKTKLNKILSNLIENAIKYTNEGFIEFGYKVIQDWLEIYVRDTGIGIDRSKQKIIFERFSQAEKDLSKKVGGLGLGLSIAQENVELLGGKISLISAKGQGSTFLVRIPYHPLEVADSIIPSNMLNGNSFTKKHQILVVEDEEVNYLYLEALLANEFEQDFNILHAKNGVEAVRLCEDNSDIELVLMDLKIPIMSGFEATQKIKGFRRQLPIIAQTAYSSSKDEELARKVGCDEFLTKPLNSKKLNNIITKYLV